MELKKSWTVILLALDRSNGQCEASLYVTAITQLMRFSLLDLKLYLTEVHIIMKFAVQVTVHYLRSWHIIHELPSMHGHVTWYIIYHMIRHLPSIHRFIYNVSFLLVLFYSGKTVFYRLQVRLRLRVGYLFLSVARNKYNADTFQGGDDENEIELLWS